MPTMLVQSCSKSKIEPDEPVPALDLYTGYFYKIIKKAMREDDFNNSIDICILSAKHGLIEPETEIQWYDKRMDEERAKTLQPEVRQGLKNRVENNDYNSIIVNMGEVYRKSIDGLENDVEANVEYITGRLGERGRTLKHRIRQSQPTSAGAD